MSNFVLSLSGVAYYSTTTLTTNTNTAYKTALGSAIVIPNIQNAKLTMSSDKADISTRGGTPSNNGWKSTAETLKDATITFNLVYKIGDSVFGALLTAYTGSQTSYMGNTEIFASFLDGPEATTGNQGIAGNWMVSSIARTEDLNGVMMADIELVPSSWTGWVTI